MFPLSNYRFEQPVYASATTVVVRARRAGDGLPVVVKQLRDEYPRRAAIEGLKHEYAMLRHLAIPEVANALALEEVGNGLALVLEDAGAEPVDGVARRSGFGGAELLRLMIGIARAVHAIHRKGIIHKDLKPAHMLRDGSGAVKLIDFGISTPLAQERREVVDPDLLEGTLAYIAPEQTGRMNRAVDRRSDLYSLGVSYFELATGRLPFRSSDPLELVHGHIAKTAPRADAVRPGIPGVVASIVEKLMAKVAEDRYQTAAGLISDLERCLGELEGSGAITPFELGSKDLSDVLHLPQKLYGRQSALDGLQASFDQVRSGRTQLLLLAGPSGVGKSALVQELRKHLVLRGHFVSGKFDQLRGSAPYPALAEACRELLRAILREPKEALAARRRALVEALGANARVVVDVVPELALIIGGQPPPPPLGPAEAQNRFEQAFERFFGALVTADEPLVMFLDDLQWADAASLRLLRQIVTAPGRRPLLVLAAYRENEVSGVHPLVLELAEFGKTAADRVRTLRLEPLGLEDVVELSSDALSRERDDVRPLATVLYEKTRGNPFDLGQFLQAAFRDGMLRPDAEGHRWVWDLPAIEARRATDNVVELVVERLRALSAPAQTVLSLGACVGHEFDSDTMALIAELGRAELVQGLEAALREGMLLPLDGNHRYLATSGADAQDALNARFRFAHDRVQQAAYALIEEPHRQLVHLRIGRHLCLRLGDPPSDGALFAVARQMNRGAACIDDPGERIWLARLNLTCAQRAQATAAAAVALDHLNHALEILGEGGWSHHASIACPAHLAKAECEYLGGNQERALASLDEVEAHATEVLDKVAAGNLRALVQTSLGRFPEACRTSVTTLRLLGVDMPDPDDVAALRRAIGPEFAAVQAALAGREISTLRDLPEMTDPLQLAQLGTFGRAIPAAYQSNQELMVLLVLKGARLPLLNGAADLASFFFAQYAIAHLAITGDHATAHQFGKVAIELGLSRANRSAVGPTHFIFAGFVSPWCEPIARSLEHFALGLKRCLEGGDVLHAAYCVGMGALYQVHAGRSLDELRAALPLAFQMVDRMGNVINQSLLRLSARFVACMAGESERFGSLDGDGFDEARFEAQVPPIVRCWLYWSQEMVRFHAGDYQATLDIAAAVTPTVGMVGLIDFRFYAGLSHAALARTTQGAERSRHVQQLEEIVEIVRSWAQLSKENQAHRLALLLAERADLQGEVSLAMEQYEEAIAGARREGFLQNHALACELCGRFHLRGRRSRVARAYLVDAVQAYERWGAPGKAAQLVAACAELDLGGALHGEAPACDPRQRSSSTKGRSNVLDLESAMRATQAIASELESDRLLDRLLRIVVENAGAQRGVLVLPRDGDLVIVAERTVEPDEVRLRVNRPVGAGAEVPVQIIRYVARTREAVVSGDAVADPSFGSDDYVLGRAPKSVLCLPLMHQGVMRAVLYLENRAAQHVFGPARVARIQFLAGHAASALENSRLYEEVQAAKRELEGRVEARTLELSQRNKDLHGVLDAVSQGLVTIDRDGRVVGEVSARAVAWFGPIEERHAWIEVLARVDPDGARAFGEYLRQVAGGAEGARGFGRMPRTLSVGGRTLSLELRMFGDPRGWARMLVVVSDITDEQRQKQLELELHHAQKLESVGQLAAGIAHEINTPVQFVGDSLSFLSDSFRDVQGLLAEYRKALGALAAQPGAEAVAAQLARADADADIEYIEEKAPAAFARSLDGLSRIATLVGAMKEFAHADQREKAPADLNRALGNTLIIARNETKMVAEVETELGELPLVMCHLSDINQVFLNLLVNAAHAVGDGVGKGGPKGRIRVKTRQVGDTVHIEVEDTGCGIPEQIRDRIFDPFFTTKEVGRGSGQGLAIARSIVVDKHGGTLTFQSTVGQGTTFIVVLPLGASAGERPGPAAVGADARRLAG
jgi:predicted ATPase/signal transduction histidine kinase